MYIEFHFLVLLFSAGNICTYVSNKRMTVAIDTIEKTVKDNLDDVDTFLNLVETVTVYFKTYSMSSRMY